MVEPAVGQVELGDRELTLTSVGIDIGSATTQVVVSRLAVVLLNGRYEIVRREQIHTSPVLLTPYVDRVRIDPVATAEFVEKQYAAISLTPEDVDTGVLLMTGTALLRTNAEAVGRALAAWSGRLVSVSAGDALEGTIAAHGSGAVARSLDGEDVLNIDVGGGTTKLTRCAAGMVTGVAAIDVGARLIAWDDDRRVHRLEDAGSAVAERVGIRLAPGDLIEDADAVRIAEHLARQVIAAADLAGPSAADAPYRTLPLPTAPPPSHIVLSGGITRFLAQRHPSGFGDLGPALAASLERLLMATGIPVSLAAAGIGATVIGAAQHTVQLSGATIAVTPGVLPIRDTPVIPLQISGDVDAIDPARVADEIVERVGRLAGEAEASPVAVHVAWSGLPTYERLAALARGLSTGLTRMLDQGHPMLVVTDADIARLLGTHLSEAVSADVAMVCVDGISLTELDFIDLGEVIQGTTGLPVTIKSIAFPQMA